jgi:hypothetical protein
MVVRVAQMVTQIALGGAGFILTMGILRLGIVFIKNGNGFAKAQGQRRSLS